VDAPRLPVMLDLHFGELLEIGVALRTVFALDLIDVPWAAGCVIQSFAAAERGAPWPELPSLAPRPQRQALHVLRARPTRRPAATVTAIHTDFHVIPPGGDY